MVSNERDVMSAVKVGIVGAGPWAHSFHAPMIVGGPETELAAIWARRSEAAAELAAAHGSRAVDSFDELLEVSDAIVFAVPPDVQAELAPRAAAAGKALLLEKPIGLNLAQAEALVDALDASNAVTQVMFTNRYSARVQDFIAEARNRTAVGAIGKYINGACLPGGYFATPWRVLKGALLDLGPHMLDLLDASLGPIVDISGKGDPTTWFLVTAEHESGAISTASLSLTIPTDGEVTGINLFTTEGEMFVDFVGKDGDPQAPHNIRAEFAATVARGSSHEMDIHRALYIQRLLDKAERGSKTVKL
jgi:predicted dehydrogenase